MSYVKLLADKGIAKPPGWLPHNMHYETMMGSVAYGVSADTSDMDIYGWCVPLKEDVFPHLRGEIIGFGNQKHRFGNYQQHHLKLDDKEYDLNVYNIVDYFQLVMSNNPNMIDSLFTPDFCVLHITRVGQMVRDARRMFLHKKCWHTFKGYAYQQVKKMGSKERESSKRQEMVDKYGYDLKFAYHVVRLLNEVEQIMTEGDLDLLRCREQLKSIRRGEWKEQDIKDYFATKERELETLYTESKIPYGPDEGKIKQLLLDCLEQHYGNLSNCIELPDKYKTAMEQVAEIVRKAGL